MSTEDDKINTGALATLVAVGLFAMIAITSAVTALVRYDVNVAQQEKDADANDTVVALKATQKAVLSAPPHYLDPAAGKVAMPIDMAASLVVNELRRDPNSATPAAPASAAPPSPSAAPVDDKKPTDAKAADGKPGDKKAPKSGDKPTPAVPPAPAPPVAPTPNH
jgi:hypothetical protein